MSQVEVCSLILRSKDNPLERKDNMWNTYPREHMSIVAE